MAVIIQDGNLSGNRAVVNSDGSLKVALTAQPTIDLGDVQIKGITAGGSVLPIKVTDDGSGLGKVVCDIE